MVGVMRRWTLRALIIYAVASLAAAIVLGEFAVQRGRLPGGGRDARGRAEAVAAPRHARVESVRIVAADGVVLAERLIREHKVATIPGPAFGLTSGCSLRLSYGALAPDTVAEGIDRLVAGLGTILRSE